MTQKKLIEKENTKCTFLTKKTTKIIGLIVGTIIIIGVVLAILLNIFAPIPFACTARSCNPPSTEGYFEVPCNTCGGEGVYFFYTGLINFKKICPGEQILIFQDGELINEIINIKECKYVLHFLR